MPRQVRLDAPGTLHLVILQGIEKHRNRAGETYLRIRKLLIMARNEEGQLLDSDIDEIYKRMRVQL